MTEALLERIKALRDPLRLKEYYFYLMWHYLRIGEFERGVETCDLGIKLADELGAKPVQYNTIKALALINLGRYGKAWDALQMEVTEEAFGSAMQQYGLAFYLMTCWLLGRRPSRPKGPPSWEKSSTGPG